METSGTSFNKTLLFTFNLFFAISGIGLMVGGALVLKDVSKIKFFINDGLSGPSIVLIVTGAIVFIIAFLGCFGAIKESYKMLTAFAVLLIIIFLVEFAVGIAAAVYKSKFEGALNVILKRSLEKFDSDPERKHAVYPEKLVWNYVQKELHCCGIDGPSDWKRPPRSCCSLFLIPIETCINDHNGRYWHKTGCYGKLQTKINSKTNILIGVSIGIALIEIVGIFLACWLAHTIKKDVSE